MLENVQFCAAKMPRGMRRFVKFRRLFIKTVSVQIWQLFIGLYTNTYSNHETRNAYTDEIDAVSEGTKVSEKSDGAVGISSLPEECDGAER